MRCQKSSRTSFWKVSAAFASFCREKRWELVRVNTPALIALSIWQFSAKKNIAMLEGFPYLDFFPPNSPREDALNSKGMSSKGKTCSLDLKFSGILSWLLRLERYKHCFFPLAIGGLLTTIFHVCRLLVIIGVAEGGGWAGWKEWIAFPFILMVQITVFAIEACPRSISNLYLSALVWSKPYSMAGFRFAVPLFPAVFLLFFFLQLRTTVCH